MKHRAAPTAPAPTTVRPAVPPPRRVVVGIDGGPASRSAYRRAVAEARARDAQVEVVTVYDPAQVTGCEPLLFAEREARRCALEAQRSVSETDAATAEDVATSWLLVEGDPAELLVTTSRGAVALVLGADGPPCPDGVRTRCREMADCAVLEELAPLVSA